MSVRPSVVRTSVRPSTKSFFDFSEIRHAGRGRWVMHEGVQYDPIQGRGQGQEPLKVGKSAIFNGYLLPHLQWGLASDHAFLNYGTIPKGYCGRKFDFHPSFCVTWLWSWHGTSVARSRPSVPLYGANLLYILSMSSSITSSSSIRAVPELVI